MGTAGRWRVGANPSVRKEEGMESRGTRIGMGHPVEWGCAVPSWAVWIVPSPQMTPNPRTEWDETLTE